MFSFGPKDPSRQKKLIAPKEYAGKKGRGRTEQPLDPPYLYRLPVEDRICAEDEPDQHSSENAGDPSQESHQGRGWQTYALFDAMEFEVMSKFRVASPGGRRGQNRFRTLRSAHVAKTSTYHKFRGAALANFRQNRRGSCGRGRLTNRSSPELAVRVLCYFSHKVRLLNHSLASQSPNYSWHLSA